MLIVSRFNKVGNREMYMNCAGKQIIVPRSCHPTFLINTVVNIVPRGTRTMSSKPSPSQHLAVRDTAKINAVAQAALASYPDLFVANLPGINTCVAPETHNVVFGDPGRAVQFGDDVGAVSKPTFQRNACTGKGHTSVSTSSDSTSPPPSSSGSSTSGDDGQWHGSDSTQQQSPASSSIAVAVNDGKSNPGLYVSTTGHQTPSSSQASQKNTLQPVDVQQGGKQLDEEVEKELNAYLAQLYETKAPKKRRSMATTEADDAQSAAIIADTLTRTRRQKRWSSYQPLSPNQNDNQDTSDTQATSSDLSTISENSSVAPQAIDASFAAFLVRLNSLSTSLFTLVKFASSYLDQAPPSSYYGSSAAAGSDASDVIMGPDDVGYTRARRYLERDGSMPANEEMANTPFRNAMNISTALSENALRQWLEGLKTQIATMKNHLQSTAARFRPENNTLLRRKTSLVGANTEKPFDWGSLYPSLQTNTSEGEESNVRARPRPAIAEENDSAPSTNPTITTTKDAIVHPPPASKTKDTWIDGVFRFLLLLHATPLPGTDSDAAAVFPFIMGPGPALPSGVSVNGVNNLEDMPTVVVDDLENGSEAQDGVREFFEGLKGEGGGAGSSRSG